MKLKKTEIMHCDFAGIMSAMQDLGKLDVDQLARMTTDVRNEIEKLCFKRDNL
jgi:hypothetical protein